MAKPIPGVKAKPPKKKHVGSDRLTKIADEAMVKFGNDVAFRYNTARRFFKAQNDDTQDSIERIAEMLILISRTQMYVGIGNDKLVRDLSLETVKAIAFYMAVEIVKDLGVMDVKVADFTFPSGLCATCGTEIKLTKKKVKK